MTADELESIRLLLHSLNRNTVAAVRTLMVGYLDGPSVLQKPEHIALDEYTPEELIEAMTRTPDEGERLIFDTIDAKKEATRLLLARAFPPGWWRVFSQIWADAEA